MRPIPWILTIAALFSVVWSIEKANRREVFNIGTNVILMCSNKTWNEIFYVTWNITVRGHSCRISSSNDGQKSVNTCKDGKSLQNTSRVQPYLHIPNFSADDVGLYMCESPYNGGSENYNINVSITVAPKISAWLEGNDSDMVAFCRAEQGNPAANISWSPAVNTSVEITQESDGFFTVESRLSEEEFPENLTCIISHQLWSQDKTLVPDWNKTKTVAKAHLALAYTGVVGVVLVILAGFLYFVLKKPTLLPLCQQTDTSRSKPPVTDEVEEVEPYASYVQRVNSIYN
ncbi:cell surface glycoprotein CD200 receptor 1-B isoform X2 [Oryzias melastigma]|uniref:Cell surface glycoprotein CD200 receptor 1-B-like n=1 Tax=Oryzias melastigma TaxID=30732 RepID=A0A3B3BR49_ORYME|nr:cell surface glycoprotein CD200 receptor 1-B isoform X2 [Oryzias melastigma]